MSRGINALLLDLCVDYQRFVEELTKGQQLQQILQDNTTSQKLSKTHVPSTKLEIMCGTSRGRLHLFVSETLLKTLFSSMYDFLHLGANASIRLVSDRFVWPRMKEDIRQWAIVCVPGQKAKVRRHTRSPFGSFPLPDEQFAHVHMDVTGHCLNVRVNHILRWLVFSLVRRFSLAGYHRIYYSKDFSCRLGISFWGPSCNYLGQRRTVWFRSVQPVNEVIWE